MGKSKELFRQFRNEIEHETQQNIEGEINTALDVYQYLSHTEKEIKRMKSEIFDSAMRDAENGADLPMFEVSVKQGRTTLNYKGIREFDIANERLSEIKDKYKNAYQQALKGNLIINEDTGEQFEVPKATISENSISFKQKKNQPF